MLKWLTIMLEMLGVGQKMLHVDTRMSTSLGCRPAVQQDRTPAAHSHQTGGATATTQLVHAAACRNPAQDVLKAACCRPSCCTPCNLQRLTAARLFCSCLQVHGLGPLTLLLEQALNGPAGHHLCLLHGIIDAGLGRHTVVLQEKESPAHAPCEPQLPTSGAGGSTGTRHTCHPC